MLSAVNVYPSPDHQWSPVTIPNAQSCSMSANGITYRVSIALPGGQPPTGRFPVLYLLDANAGFATVVETHRRLSRRSDATGVGPAIIIGIGHDTGELYDTALRERDFTPKDQGGDAEAFLDFIECQLKPEIQDRFPLDTKRQILAGHSLSAYFALWVMVRRPRTFQSYVAASPSLWRDETLQSAITDARRNDISHAFIAAGEWEEALAPWQAGQDNAGEILQRRLSRGMISRARDFAATLGAHIGPERVQFEVFSDEDHASVFGVAISRAMRTVLRTS